MIALLVKIAMAIAWFFALAFWLGIAVVGALVLWVCIREKLEARRVVVRTGAEPMPRRPRLVRVNPSPISWHVGGQDDADIAHHALMDVLR
jgi:hypothetical protein